jgi:hypothetical protein
MKGLIGKNIIGTWKLVSWVYVDEALNEVDFFGKNPIGILMYDASGYMNAQLMQRPRANFGSQSMYGGTESEVAAAYNTYAAYYGQYYENSPGELVHVVEGSLFPNWVGQNEVRYAKIEEGHLYLSTPPVQVDNKTVVFKVKWERITAQL